MSRDKWACPPGQGATRRDFIACGAALAATALCFPLAARCAQVGTEEAVPEAMLQLAGLGAAIRQAQPAVAARLESLARESAGIARDSHIDLDNARNAQAQLCTATRISAELAAGDVVFADGWLLTASEAGAALLLATALKS